jgi:hypothetical protein
MTLFSIRCVLSCVFFALAACDSAQLRETQATVDQSAPKLTGEKRMNAPSENVALLDWQSPACTSAEKIIGLDGLTDTTLAAKLGAVHEVATFAMADKQDEFHIGLQNKYPLTKKTNAAIQIREMTWLGKTCKLTVWLDQQDNVWHAFDNLRYSTDTEF